MPDIRNPVGAPTPSPARAPDARSDAVRAAQRAFFDAALRGPATAQSAVAPAQTSASAVAAARAGAFRAPDPQTPPSRLLRPGSLLDIKV